MDDRHSGQIHGSVFLDPDGSLNARIVFILGIAISVVIGFMIAGARDASECPVSSQNTVHCGD